MSARRTERLLNLVIALLSTRRWLTKEQIRAAVPQYAQSESLEAFDRMFERDKEELRELGVPVVTGSDSAWFEDEVGYRIDRDAYALPAIEFTPAELAVLGLASQVWQQASLAGPAARALVKLKALGVEPDAAALVGIEPRVRTSEPSFEPLYTAARDRVPVSFTYRRADGSSTVRTVEPWLMTFWHGRWYLVGHDRDRADARVFRLSRVSGRVRRVGPAGSYEVPADVDARAMVRQVGADAAPATATVRLRPGAGQSLRIRAGAGLDERVVRVQYSDPAELAETVAWHGPDAVVLDPTDLREAVLGLLTGALHAHEPATGQPVGEAVEQGAAPPADAEAAGRETTRTDRTRPGAASGTGRTPTARPVSGSAGGAGDRLSRLLALVPYLTDRQGVPLAEAARHFDITEAQLVSDLQLLFVCGAPGHLPDDLIEAEWESGRVYLSNAEAIARPLRLGPDEAVALLAGLRTLADVPAAGVGGALDSARAKLSAAAGQAARAADAVRVDLSAGAAGQVLSTVQEALASRRRLHLRYLVAARDETTERDVDPMRLVGADGHWYLEAWCHRVHDVRLFRLDRVLAAQMLDVDGTPPPHAVGRDLDADLFRPGPDDITVTLDLGPDARWVAEYYPVEAVTEQPDGALRVRLRTPDAGWLRRLLLRLGGRGRVVDPPWLVAQTHQLAAQALAAHHEAGA